MRRFSEQNELINFAKQFVEDRVNVLDKDVRHCLAYPLAPFPAILLCFSTIDLLGALLAGDASRKARTSDQSIQYMRRFMHYTEEQSQLLVRIFRHKLVHLAQPKPVIEYDGKHIAWKYWHDREERHLMLTKLPETATVQITSCWSISADHEFEISIAHLVKDIKDSAHQPDGYLHSLQRESDLQDRFENAISQIYAVDTGIGG